MQRDSTCKRRGQEGSRSQVKTHTVAFCHMALACAHRHGNLTPLGKMQIEGNKDNSRQSQMKIDPRRRQMVLLMCEIVLGWGPNSVTFSTCDTHSVLSLFAWLHTEGSSVLA